MASLNGSNTFIVHNSPLGPSPETKSQGTGLLIKVAIARYAERKASLDICLAVPLFYLTEEHKDIIMPRNRLKWYR